MPYDIILQTLAIIVPVFCTSIFALIAFGVKQMIRNLTLQIAAVGKEITEHRESCNEREQDLRKWSHWTTDAVTRIASKTSIDLPDRPY